MDVGAVVWLVLLEFVSISALSESVVNTLGWC